VNGKLVGGVIVLSALLAGGAIYYLQEYAYYHDAAFTPGSEIVLTTLAGATEPIPVRGLVGVDADSSPLRFRACFHSQIALPTLTDAFQIYERAEPLIAPSWFDCFDAERIGAALESGEAVAFLGQAGIAPQVDRVIAVFPDGSAFAWHQLQPGANATQSLGD
jgi:Family of unknown function (DUF6446)